MLRRVHCGCYRYISYPRTETNIFPASFDLPAIVSQQTPDPAWGGKCTFSARSVESRLGC